MFADQSQKRLIILSHRLPFSFYMEDDAPVIQLGSGGLVTALAPVLKDRGGLWIGYAGNLDNDDEKLNGVVNDASKKLGFEFAPVFLTDEDIELYYCGFSNEIIWPLFHDMPSLCHFRPEYWSRYVDVNKKFTDVVIKNCEPDDFIWVHDYQLMRVGLELREKKVSSRVGFFLHIPFPSVDIFSKLPWRFEILHALLAYDLIGFQAPRDRRNFIQCVKALLKEISVKSYPAMHTIDHQGHVSRVANIPISIDFKEFAGQAKTEKMAKLAWCMHEKWPEQKVIFSIDRLDHTKGIPYRLEAIRTFLQNYPEYHQKVCFVQVVVPSRTDIAEYQALKREVDRLVGEINSEFTTDSWVPIQYIFRSLSREELLMFYRMSEAMLVTSLKDGMNLVAKEYVASQIEETGVLILSEFAGASNQMQDGALLINPFNIEQVAENIQIALTMTEKERITRMKKLRRGVKRQDVFWWLQLYLKSAFSKKLHDFPVLSESHFTSCSACSKAK